MKTKFKAFTVLEVLFTLLISATVITLVYSIYSTFSGQTYKLFNETSNTTEVYSFYSQMNIEFYKANRITYNSNILELYFYNDKKISYHHKNDSLFRLQNDLYTGSIFVKQMKVITNHKNDNVEETRYTVNIFSEDVDFEIIKNYPEISNYGY